MTVNRVHSKYHWHKKCKENTFSVNVQSVLRWLLKHSINIVKQEVKVIWQKAPHGGPIPRLGVTAGGRKLYHW